MSERKSGRTQLILIAIVFLGPLAIASWLYFGGNALQPEGRTNHGALLTPISNLNDALHADAPIHALYDNAWVLLYRNAHACDDACRKALHTMRQSRLMLGKEMDRVKRVFLHGDSAPDTVFLAEEHPGLITMEDSTLGGMLDKKRPMDIPAGGYFLVDPLGNLVMYFRPDLDPADMVDDIKHLLKLSRIG